MDLQSITFKFKDGRERVLSGEELEFYIEACLMKSDWLLPSSADDKLGSTPTRYSGGFFPPGIPHYPFPSGVPKGSKE